MRFSPLPALLFLTACPSAAPSADQFAADVSAADLGTLGDGVGSGDSVASGDSATPEDSASPMDSSSDSGAADAQSDTAGPTDASQPVDSLQPDGGAGPSLCSTGLELFAKDWSGGAEEGFEAVVPDKAGGALLLGGNGSGGNSAQGIALRVSALGGVAWSKALGGPEADRLHAGLATAEGFVAVGMSRQQGSDDGWLVRFASDGKVLGEQKFGGSSTDGLYAIAPAGDGWMAAGSNRSIGGGLEDGWLVRTGADGQMLWEQKYGGSSIDNLTAIAALPGGNFAAVGDNRSDAQGGSDAWLIIVDPKGKVLHSKTFHSGEYDEAKAVAVLPSGGLVIAGKGSVNGNPEVWVIGTDAEGNQLWQEFRGGNQDETGRGIAVLPDGGFAVVADTSSSNPGALGGIDAWLMRYDAWGNRLWDKHIGGSGNEWFTGAAAAGEQGLWLAGRRWANGGLDGWYLRTGPWGHASCAAAGLCKDKFSSDCQDNSVCTADLCDSASGCSNLALPSGAPCGGGSVCAAGACQ
jgi:hypothetical protein